MNTKVQMLNLADHALAYQQARGAKSKIDAPVGILFLGGYASDMTGTKASFLAERAAEAGVDYLRFDYRGHGQTAGSLTDFTLSDWLADALDVLDRLTEGPQILVGSSMGGWLALLVARARPQRVAAVVGLAAAPDFTEDLVWDRLTPAQKETLVTTGVIEDDGLPLSLRLIEDGRAHLLLRGPLELEMPVRLIQGQQDRSVPWQTALTILDRLEGPAASVTLVKDGDHRLSRPEDLALIWRCIVIATQELATGLTEDLAYQKAL